MNNLVSIIMPAHNAAKTIRVSIESVLSQTYTDWELLIIDDCSTDESIQIINEFISTDSRVKLLHTDKSVGKPFYPRNIGIEAAQGRFIAFLDSDDIWFTNKLQNQISLFMHKDVAVVYSYYKKIDENGKNVSKEIISPDSVSYKQLLNGDCIGNLTGVYDTQKVGKVYQKNINAEDYLMWLEILKKGFVALNTKTVEGLYRIRTVSTSSNKMKSAMWTYNIYRNELKLSLIETLVHFTIYMIRGFIKYIK